MMDDILAELRALLAGETDPIANAANTASLLFSRVAGLNWAGFYFQQGEVLVVGPFQGLPACTRIPLGRGVCGTAASRGETIVVPDVHAFAGHIACDSASLSEIVVPFGIGGGLSGVLDIDSPLPDRFSEADRVFFEAVAQTYVEACRQP
jgi:L-methionine (R)-S-oxide reductase